MQFEFKIVHIKHDERIVSDEWQVERNLQALGLQGWKIVGVAGSEFNHTIYLQRSVGWPRDHL